MLWGDLAFFITAIGVVLWLRQYPPKDEPKTLIDLKYADFQKWDWVAAGIFLLFVTWMMFKTFNMGDGNIEIGHHQFPDFGSTLSIMQSFALGHNFPTQYTHFTGERIRYHFLFYYQAGNLEFLGFNPAVANNILSIFSLTSLLVLIMTFGAVVFRSRLVGRIGAALFFFHGSLAFIPFLLSIGSFAELIEKLNAMTMFLKSGFTYRGEDWGVWSQNVYLNQRHLSSAIGLFLLVLIFVAMRYREYLEAAHEQPVIEAESEEDVDQESSEDAEPEKPKGKAAEKQKSKTAAKEVPKVEEDDDEEDEEEEDDDEDGDEADEPKAKTPSKPSDLKVFLDKNAVYIFSGLILGLLPLWNGAIFLSAAVVFAVIFLVAPLRRELIPLAVTAILVSLPQVIYLKTGNLKPVGYSMFHWGFVIEPAGILDVLYWTFYTFGFKWVLLGIAIYFGTDLQRRFLAAISILLPLTYCFRFSEEVLANHKFINVWLVVINVFAAFALVKLWDLKVGKSVIPMRVVAVILLLLITIGGAIDLMPIKNSYFIKLKYDDDKLITWVKTNTDPSAIFLSHRFINHQILLAGRRLFFGDPYYAWGTDYDTESREKVVSAIFEATDPNEAYRLLKENNISYVAFDDQIRNTRQYIKNPNEELFKANFQIVFSDDAGEYDHIKIYKVPDEFVPSAVNNPSTGESTAAPAFNAFVGGEGPGVGTL